MALMVLMGDAAEEFEAYEFRLLDIMEVSDGERPRLKEVRMLEKDTEWKREVRIFAGVSGLVVKEC